MRMSIISSVQPLESGSRQYSSISAAVYGERAEGRGQVRGFSLHSLCAGPRTGGFLVAPLLAKKAETESIIVARLSSKPMVAGPARAELKEATVRGVCTGRTKALHDRTERRTTKRRIVCRARLQV